MIGVAVMSAVDPADRRPARRARLANALLPGAGLVAQGQTAAGLLLGLGFYWPLTAALFVTWLAPSALPGWLVMGLAAGAVAVYLGGQLVLSRVLARRAGRIVDHAARTVPLMRGVYQAMTDGDWVRAQILLDELLAFDSEHFEASLTQSRLLAISRKTDPARRAYRRCRRLDRRKRWRWEIDRETGLLDGS